MGSDSTFQRTPKLPRIELPKKSSLTPFLLNAADQAGMVPKAGFEPARVSPHAPQTCVSAIPPLRRRDRKL
jgi:hypothetical protein